MSEERASERATAGEVMQKRVRKEERTCMRRKESTKEHRGRAGEENGW